MRYGTIVPATFLERENRFVARVRIGSDAGAGGGEVRIHVKNTGRCRELLVPGAAVYLEDFDGRMGTRKMRYDLVTVEKRGGGAAPGTDAAILVNIDSQAPNKAAEEALREGRVELPGLGRLTCVQREVRHEESRLDFRVTDEEGRTGWIEVKGVTLEQGGHATFPDAPTERGRKHLGTLCRILEEGDLAYVLFVIQMRPMLDFGPNEEHDPAFAAALREARDAGVRVLAYDCLVTPETMTLHGPVPVIL